MPSNLGIQSNNLLYVTKIMTLLSVYKPNSSCSAQKIGHTPANSLKHFQNNGLRQGVRMAKKSRKKVPLRAGVGTEIKRLRESLGITVAVLAKKIGVSRNTLTNYESEITEPTVSHLNALARELGTTVSELLLERGNELPRFAFRANKSVKKCSKTLGAAKRWLKCYEHIEEITSSQLPDRLRPWMVDSPEPLSDREIESVAESLREACGLHDSGPENIAAVLESLGVRCLFLKQFPDKLDGISVIQGQMMLVMLQDRTKCVERVFFSGAHELGHLVLHHHFFSAEADEIDSARDYEKEANAFAGRFLLPANEVIRVWREDRLSRLSIVDALLMLKRVFHVSFWALHYRVSELGLTRVERPELIQLTKGRLAIKGTAKMDQLELEPFDSGALFRTTRFNDLVRSAFLQDRIGRPKVAELMQISTEEASELSEAWTTPAYDELEEVTV